MTNELNEQQQQQMIDFIDRHDLENFCILYDNLSSSLKRFEHLQLLFQACRFGNKALVEKILMNNEIINVNSCDRSNGCSPLLIAIRGQQHEIIRYLIEEMKADINLIFKSNTTCLHEALRKRDLFIVELLLQYNVTVDIHHLLVSLVECFRGEKEKTNSPLVLFDTLISHRQELLQGDERTQMLDFIVRRARWSSLNENNRVFSQLFQRLSFDDYSKNLIEDDPLNCSQVHRTQVGIIGAGPAGLMLGALLHAAGIDSIILERHSRHDVESHIRAGVLEQGTVDLLDSIDVSERLLREGFVQPSIIFQFDGERMSLPIMEMTEGRTVTVYGQNYLLRDLIEKRLNDNQRLWFDIENSHIERNEIIEGEKSNAVIRFRRHHHDQWEEIHCDFLAGCDGSVSKCCRQSIPSNILQTIEKNYPFSWLSLSVAAPPSGLELVYSSHSKYGFAIHSFRSVSEVRFHLQISSNETLTDWSDERIWKELELRLTPTNQSTWKLNKGQILQRAIFPIRSHVTSPMQYKRLFLLGDAAHILPPTGAKGLNVAVNDAKILSEAVVHFYTTDSLEKINSYTESCLEYVWQAELFANTMTLLLHNLNGTEEDNDRYQEGLFDAKLQQRQRIMLQQSHALQMYCSQMIAH